MKREIRDRWTAALRSGEFSQGRGELNYGDSEFCCLGVLCELAARDGIVEKHFQNHKGESTGSILYDGEDGVMPNVVRNWAELDYVNAAYYGNGYLKSLARDNDSGLTFGQIAEIIEEKF